MKQVRLKRVRIKPGGLYVVGYLSDRQGVVCRFTKTSKKGFKFIREHDFTPISQTNFFPIKGETDIFMVPETIRIVEVKRDCLIFNLADSWVLMVDNQNIPFTGSHNADYFKEIYTKLGYNVIIKDEVH